MSEDHGHKIQSFKAQVSLVPGRKPKILLCTNEDWFFLSHRLTLGLTCLKAGWDVQIATRVSCHADKIRDHGLGVTGVYLRRGSVMPFKELVTLSDILRVVRRERPDVIHLVGLKMILYGSIASLFLPGPPVICAVSGMGTLFTRPDNKAGLIARIVMKVLKPLLGRRRSWVITQNKDDQMVFDKLTAPGHATLIRGVGVDINEFAKAPEPDGPIHVILGARMIGEKGIYEAVEAMRLLKSRNVDASLVLIGSPDPENPSCIPEQTLNEWNDEGLVDWRGRSDDVAADIRKAHIAILPSYREGFPKFLIEAMSMGRPVVTTDVIGCRDVVEDGISGMIVPARDPDSLADALEVLIKDPGLRRRIGDAARERVESCFSDITIAEETLKLYYRTLSELS